MTGEPKDDPWKLVVGECHMDADYSNPKVYDGTNWIPADGREVSRTSHADLFLVYGRFDDIQYDLHGRVVTRNRGGRVANQTTVLDPDVTKQ